MAKKIIFDIESKLEADIAGIVFSGNSYVLASRINTVLDIDLIRAEDLEIRNKKNNIDDSFPLYIYSDIELEIDYILLQNKSNIFLLPEYKNINYIFILRGKYRADNFNFFINKISKIADVNFVFSIDGERLASKNNLIF